MTSPFLSSLRLDGFLSFAPGSPATVLRSLNVIIGPNGSGKSNLIEGVELLKATPSGFGAALRLGGSADAWIWKGGECQKAEIEANLYRPEPRQAYRYRMAFAAAGTNPSIEAEDFESIASSKDETAIRYLSLRGTQVEIAAKPSGGLGMVGQ